MVGSTPGAGGSGGTASDGGTGGGSGGSDGLMGNGGSASPLDGMTPVAGGSGGVSGSAGSGGTSAGGPVCPDTALFCDDFEDDGVGQGPGSPWRNDANSGATVNVETLRAFSGTNAVHVNAPAGAAYRRGYFALDQGSSPVFPALSQEMYGRAMMWLEQAPNADAHWTFIQGEGTSGTMPPHNRLYRFGGQHQNGLGLMANFETTMVSTDCWDHSASTMPTGAWVCVEWRFAVASNEMQFWLNGAELEDIHVTGRGEGCVGNALNGDWLAPPAFQTLYLGWEHYQPPANDINLWVDAVAVGAERVGCPAAPSP